ncbi:hypothetical protein [Saccharothrix variisporea]|uniref:Uncharacterized protein n=1 Tax=Saccharothrix variisporea TaxID=543527 RepID=A0A495X4P7_9PSEU|nr:hypothetical protein [Saccharothrix variisporea]RKT68084.1 hypothetical protein DFJ66_1265 [Saccharothrix variisporea]
MNEAELVELLRERADIPDEGHRTRVEGVRAKVRRSRWQQAGGILAAVVVVLAGLLYAVPRGPSSDPADPPGESLPTYQDGYRFSTTAFATLPERTKEVTYEVKGDFLVYAHCAITDLHRTTILIKVNDRVWYDGPCDRNGGPVLPPRDARTAYGIRLGQPIRIELSLPDPAARTGRWGIRIGEAVAFADYSFPPRPSQLAALPRGDQVVAWSHPEHPDGQFETRFPWPDAGELVLWTNSPGRFRVFVNGVPVVEAVFFDYGVHWAPSGPISEWSRLYGLDVKPGQEVVLLVIPERAAGQWQVTQSPAQPR